MSSREDLEAVADDLEAEEQILDDLVADLDDDGWDAMTVAEGWTVRHTIGHLASSEELAAVAATDEEEFRAVLADVIENLEEFESGLPPEIAALSNAELLERWRSTRDTTIDAVRAKDPDDRIAWVGPSMKGRAFLTARLMETWSHGRDIFDALGQPPPPASERLRHIAHLGAVTRAFAYANRGREAPGAEVRIELDAPSGGDLWTWGPADATDRVTGPAEDFCLVVSQRRNVADTALVVEGDAASDWMTIVQCFAGPATDPPAPGTRLP
ncbi:MAG: TIGR03084 family metal-binding protein [Acidimicrobiia bacterium]|nr:TIGR03084 family metal-binding protein [Acidimicrobiia bacterium]